MSSPGSRFVQNKAWYDGPGEMERETTLAALCLFERGGEWSPEEAFKGAGLQHNTFNKAINILRFHGYNIKDRRINHENGKHHYVYWLEKKLSVAPRGKAGSEKTVVTSEMPENWLLMSDDERFSWLYEKCSERLATYPENHPDYPKILLQMDRYKQRMAA
jgi:hypothetical protein